MMQQPQRLVNCNFASEDTEDQATEEVEAQEDEGGNDDATTPETKEVEEVEAQEDEGGNDDATTPETGQFNFASEETDQQAMGNDAEHR